MMRPDSAQKLKDLLIEISPLIEEITSRVCPGCKDVCCKQKQCFLDAADAVYVNALGLPLPVYDPSRSPDGPCQFLTAEGCVTPRWLRPWRCTWYFCDPVLDAMNNGPQKKARKLAALIRDILAIRAGLV